MCFCRHVSDPFFAFCFSRLSWIGNSWAVLQFIDFMKRPSSLRQALICQYRWQEVYWRQMQTEGRQGKRHEIRQNGKLAKGKEAGKSAARPMLQGLHFPLALGDATLPTRCSVFRVKIQNSASFFTRHELAAFKANMRFWQATGIPLSLPSTLPELDSPLGSESALNKMEKQNQKQKTNKNMAHFKCVPITLPLFKGSTLSIKSGIHKWLKG